MKHTASQCRNYRYLPIFTQICLQINRATHFLPKYGPGSQRAASVTFLQQKVDQSWTGSWTPCCLQLPCGAYPGGFSIQGVSCVFACEKTQFAHTLGLVKLYRTIPFSPIEIKVDGSKIGKLIAYIDKCRQTHYQSIQCPSGIPLAYY